MKSHAKSRERNMVVLSVVLLLVTSILAFSPSASASSIVINTVTPGSGHVGSLVRVIGEIETVNGPYAIFFGQDRVKNGTALETMVNDTFNIPAYPKGSYDVILHDITTANNATDGFIINSAYFITALAPTWPDQLREGTAVEILAYVTGGEKDTRYLASVAVTNPLGVAHFSDLLQLTNTTDTGYGEVQVVYPADFGLGAHTDYSGVYSMTVNGTLTAGNFTVGLTDRTEYRRSFEDDLTHVHIQGSGYGTDEVVTVDVMTAEASVAGYPKNLNATDGLVMDSWRIPDDALGVYVVTLRNSTPFGTDKLVPDTQSFTIVDIIISCQTRNRYDKKPLVGVSVEVYAQAIPIIGAETGNAGWVTLRLDRGDYTFNALWDGETVGSLKGKVAGDHIDFVLHVTFYIDCELARIAISVKEETGTPLPFVNVNLIPSGAPPIALETNLTGLIVTNAATDVGYTIEFQRYGHLFDTATIENLTYTHDGRDRINTTCPEYEMFVYAVDSKGAALKNVQVEVYEWSSERLVGLGMTDSEFGSVAFHCTFGRYRVVVSSMEFGRRVTLNDTTVDLVEDRFFFTVHCRICGLDSMLKVVDLFSQPIPNAEVGLELKVNQEYVDIGSSTTSSDGTILLPDTGGDYRISVSVMGEDCETRQMYFSESTLTEVKLDRYISIGGYPLQVGQLLTLISLTLLSIVFALAWMWGRIAQVISRAKPSRKE